MGKRAESEDIDTLRRNVEWALRNALDRARLRQASRLFVDRERELTARDLTTIEAQDILASRVFQTEATPT